MSKYNNINVKSYIECNEINKKDKAIKNQSDDEVQNESEEIQNIKQMGVDSMPKESSKDIQCMTIIGEIEGHFIGNPQKKATKYEHMIPMLYSIEESSEIKGVLIILNTVGGDVEAGLAMAELINSLSKKVVTLVLGGSHSIGVPLATAGDYSFIAPTATMIVHPIRTNGLVIGINETFEYFKKMQERITQFIIRTSKIERDISPSDEKKAGNDVNDEKSRSPWTGISFGTACGFLSDFVAVLYSRRDTAVLRSDRAACYSSRKKRASLRIFRRRPVLRDGNVVLQRL